MFKNVLIDTYKIIPSFPKRIPETENWPKIVRYRGCNKDPDDKSSTAAEKSWQLTVVAKRQHQHHSYPCTKNVHFIDVSPDLMTRFDAALLAF
jgi:hypothetical protein